MLMNSLLGSMRNSETIQNINFHYLDNWVKSDHLAGCDRFGAAGQHAVELWSDRKCAVPSYAVPGVETFNHCKVWILSGICVTGGLHLGLGLLLDLVRVEVAAAAGHHVGVQHVLLVL